MVGPILGEVRFPFRQITNEECVSLVTIAYVQWYFNFSRAREKECHQCDRVDHPYVFE